MDLRFTGPGFTGPGSPWRRSRRRVSLGHNNGGGKLRPDL